jgi:hypothetical protein
MSPGVKQSKDDSDHSPASSATEKSGLTPPIYTYAFIERTGMTQP